MKKLITILLFIPFPLMAQLTVHIGDSQSKGMVGLEYRYGTISIAAGYLLMCINTDKIKYYNSYSGAITFYSNPEKTSWYFRMAGSSAGIFYQDKKIGLEYLSEPSVMGLLGLRFYPYKEIWWWNKRISLDFGAGINMSHQHILPTIECTINFDITRN
jgi:hypothetical protein